MDQKRLAVVGGGVSGAALALALLQTARMRAQQWEVKVFSAGAGGTAPAILTPECRSRLSALGCRVPQEWRTVGLKGVEVVSGGGDAPLRRELLPAPSGGLWVLDGWPHGPEGQARLRTHLRETASALGAQFIDRAVDRIEREPEEEHGHWRLRAGGPGHRADAVAVATGAGTTGLLTSLRGAPTLAGVQARLRYPTTRLAAGSRAILWLNPNAKVQGLWIIPTAHSLFVRAFGAVLDASDLFETLMSASCEGLLEEGFDIAQVESVPVPAGGGMRVGGERQLAVGAAAIGHPLQLGIADTLATATRAAVTLVESGLESRAISRRYGTESLLDLHTSATAATRSLKWLGRAGPTSAAVFRTAMKGGGGAWGSGVLGLPAPAAQRLLSAARWAGLGQSLRTFFKTPQLPNVTAPLAEPDLYYVVDDDCESRAALSQLLESQGARVVSFSDELALYAAVARTPPTAILLDVVLHWVDGLRLCEGLKRHPLTRHTRVFVMSGLTRAHIRRRALEAGAEGFLAKPIAPNQLLQTLCLSPRRGAIGIRPREEEAAQEFVAS